MRKETREQILQLLARGRALTTQEIANSIGLSRSATSLYLNVLLDQNIVSKAGTKPVYWGSFQITPLWKTSFLSI